MSRTHHPKRRGARWKGPVKADASRGRRVQEHRMLTGIDAGRIDADNAAFPTANHHVADRWNHD